ncbi:MAG: hypothetical protein IMZ62_09700 [Chloroflexi bacterium]|nr:hypothetical protein [Chloroflexota bacterium]
MLYKLATMTDRLTSVVALFSTAVFGVGLAFFAAAGTYSRYWADDYCYSAVVKMAGVLRGVVEWYKYSGNRVSTVFVVGFSEIFGQKAIQFVPLAVLLLWVGAWVFFLLRFTYLLGWKTAGLNWIGLLAVVEVYFAVLLAPDRLQTIYWRMGTFHYTLPLPLLLINLGLLAGAWRPTRRWVWLAVLCGLLSFFAAGLSETFAGMQTGLWLAGLAVVLLFARGPQRLHAARLLVLPLLGSLAMMGLMALAPANSFRQEVMPPPAHLWQIVPVSLRYAWDFIFYFVRGQLTPVLVYGLITLSIGLLALKADALQLSLRSALTGAVLSLAGMYGLVACSFAPSAYANLQYPAGRAQMPAGIALLAGLAAAAFFIAMALRKVIQFQSKSWLKIAVTLLLLAACLYPLRAAAIPRKDIQQLSVRAARWDARNHEIQQTLAAGQTDLRVAQTDVVQGLEDIGPDANYWLNRCAADYYGAHSITANP